MNINVSYILNLKHSNDLYFQADREREDRRRAMEAELTRHFMNNVAEEPDMSSGGGPPPYVSAPPSYHSSNSAPASLASSHPAPASPEVPAVVANSIPGVLNAQEESVQVLQQKLKEVQNHFIYQIQILPHIYQTKTSLQIRPSITKQTKKSNDVY